MCTKIVPAFLFCFIVITKNIDFCEKLVLKNFKQMHLIVASLTIDSNDRTSVYMGFVCDMLLAYFQNESGQAYRL